MLYCFLITSVFVSGGIYLLLEYQKLDDPELVKMPSTYASRIYDTNGDLIKKIGSDEGHVEYEDLPKCLLDAIVAIEDTSFYYHDGVDIHRVFGSIFHNLTSDSSLQGASTLTQQLARNLFLTSDQTLLRKVKELLLSFKLESTYEKEVILEFYFNNVHFDPVVPGISYASSKFFNKDVKELTLTEAATLVGLVKSPTAYQPFNHPEAANKRKNIVIREMYKNSFITKNECDHALAVSVESLLFHQKKSQEVLPYQAYLDVVYEECKRLTGLDPYSSSINVYTYMDPALQKSVDEIQSGTSIKFEDDLQQFGLALMENESGVIKAVGGGREYEGARLFNRAYDKKVGPASTIKPIFEYLLAAESLGYHRAKTLIDEETYYLSGESLKNAGNSYSGPLTLLDSIGYSKNTTAIQTLNSLTRMHGEDYLVNYLKEINMMDSGPYTESYGLGGMTEGVNLISLSAAYAMLANGGIYQEPALIESITDASGKVIYQHESKKKRVVSEEAAYIIYDILVQMVEGDYSALGRVKVKDIEIAAKTGTGPYDNSIIKRYSYPTYADRDSFVVGCTPDYSLAVWSGFDLPLENQKSYFGRNDTRRQITKTIFKTMIKKAANTKKTVEIPRNLFKTNVVKYVDQLYYANDLIPSSYTMSTYLKSYEDIEVYPLPTLVKPEVTIYEFENEFQLNFLPPGEEDSLYKRIYGELGHFVKVNDDEPVFVKDSRYTIFRDREIKSIEVFTGYRTLDKLYSDPVVFRFGNIFDSVFDL